MTPQSSDAGKDDEPTYEAVETARKNPKSPIYGMDRVRANAFTAGVFWAINKGGRK